MGHRGTQFCPTQIHHLWQWGTWPLHKFAHRTPIHWFSGFFILFIIYHYQNLVCLDVSSGSKLLPLTLKLRFTATRIACESDLFIHRPYTKDVISPVLTTLILLVYSSFDLLRWICEISLTGCMGQYPRKEKLCQWRMRMERDENDSSELNFIFSRLSDRACADRPVYSF